MDAGVCAEIDQLNIKKYQILKLAESYKDHSQYICTSISLPVNLLNRLPEKALKSLQSCELISN